LVSSVNNNFGAGFSRALFRLIGRAVINNENVIQSLASPSGDLTDMFLVLICGNNRRGMRSNIFRHVERSREISKIQCRDCSTSLGMTTNKTHTRRPIVGYLRTTG
jgi:hypothetical protein